MNNAGKIQQILMDRRFSNDCLNIASPPGIVITIRDSAWAVDMIVPKRARVQTKRRIATRPSLPHQVFDAIERKRCLFQDQP